MYTGPSSGISYDPLLEWMLAAKWGGYTIDKFQDQSTLIQSFVVAAYRCSSQIEAVTNWETQKANKTPSRGRGRRR